MTGTITGLEERHNNDGSEYPYTVVLKFEDLQDHSEFKEPVEGALQIDLSDEFPHPVEIKIKRDMVAGKNDDATYAEFERLTQKIGAPNNSPVEFRFITRSASPSERQGGKVYSFKTSNYDPEDEIPPKKNPDIIEHHIGIPSAEEVRLIAHVGSRIINEEADSNDIQKLMNVYDLSRSSSIENFYGDIKKYTSFEHQIKIMNFFMETGDIYRDYQAIVNKAAKQVAKERLRRNIGSLNDVREFVSVINSQDGLPNITLKEVFDEVQERKGGDEEELNQLAEDLGTEDWSSLYNMI